MTTAVANRVLQQINYTNASDDPDAGVSLRLTVTDVYGASGSVTLALSVAEINDAPLLSAAAANAVYTEGGDAAVLFSDAVVSPWRPVRRLAP